MLCFVFCIWFKGRRNYEFWTKRKCFDSKQKYSWMDLHSCSPCNRAKCNILLSIRIMMTRIKINIHNRFKLKLSSKDTNRDNLFKYICNRNYKKRVIKSISIDNQVSLPKIYGKCSQTSFSTQII